MSTDIKADRVTDQEFAVALKFLGKLHGLKLSAAEIQAMKDDSDHPIWILVDSAFAPKPKSESAQLPDEVLKQIGSWGIFYKKFFGIDMDFSRVKIPEKVEGFERLIIVAKGIRLNRVWNIHEERGIPRWQWWNGSLEKAVQESERGLVKDTYVIWVRDEREAVNVDEATFKELSAKVIAEREIDTENLLERLVHGLKYFDETGKHLDVKGVTFCASSRYTDGSVPFVDCRHGKSMRVHRYDVGLLYSDVRARRAVR